MFKYLVSLMLFFACISGYAQTQINGRVVTPSVYFIEGGGAPTGNCSASFNYGVVYFDHTGFNIYFCTNSGWVQGGSSGGAVLGANTFTGTQTAPGFTAGTLVNLPVPVPVATKSCTNYAGTGSVATCTWTASPAIGEFVVMGTWSIGASSTMTMSDSAGNTYTPIAAAHSALTTYKTQLFLFGPLLAPITTTTVTSTSGAGTGLFLQGNTVTNIATSSPVDGSICHSDTSLALLSCAITTTVANDYIFCNATTGTAGLSIGTGFTAGSSFNNFNVAQYQIQPAVGATTSTMNGAASPNTMSCVALKPGSGTTLAGGAIVDAAILPGQCVQATTGSLLIGSLCGSQANLPGTPNLVYSFVAPGDQTGNIIHDISGNSNNSVAINGAFPFSIWTGTGFTLAQGGAGQPNFNFYMGLPTAVISDQTYCASVYLPYYTNPAGNINTAYAIVDSANYQGWTFTTQYGGNPFNSTFGQYAVINSTGGAFAGSIAPEESGFHTKCWVMGLSSNSTTDQFYQDGVNDSSYGGRNGGAAVGQWYLSPQGGSINTTVWYYLAAWPGQLTAAQVQQASYSMTQAVASRGVPIRPSTVITQKPTILAVGDSITCCGGTVTTWWPGLLTGNVSSAYGTVVNEGLGGFPVIALNDQALWRDTPYCSTGNQKSLVILFAGTNDGLFNNYTAAATFGYIQGYVNKLTAAGCQVGVATMLSRTALDTFKNTLNPLIRNGAANGNYFVLDGASVPLLGADGSFSGADFSGDNVHPNQTGQNAIAGAFENAINAYGIGASSQANPTVYSSNAVTMLSADVFATIIPTAAATATLPDCLGVTGTVYQVFNASAGAFTITFSGKASEAISGSATLAQNVAGRFQATLISQSAGGCGWQRVL